MSNKLFNTMKFFNNKNWMIGSKPKLFNNNPIKWKINDPFERKVKIENDGLILKSNGDASCSCIADKFTSNSDTQKYKIECLLTGRVSIGVSTDDETQVYAWNSDDYSITWWDTRGYRWGVRHDLPWGFGEKSGLITVEFDSTRGTVHYTFGKKTLIAPIDPKLLRGKELFPYIRFAQMNDGMGYVHFLID